MASIPGMSSHPLQSALDLPIASDLASSESKAARGVQQEVLWLFDQNAPKLRRYVSSFGLTSETTEDVVQEVFLSLFRHLRLGRPRDNLTGWLFQVGHNLALKQRQRSRRQQKTMGFDADLIPALIDPAANPEQQMMNGERRRRFRRVMRALPEQDRRCLYLRAEGLRYREIARTLGISLGSVAKSIARATARLMNADRRSAHA